MMDFQDEALIQLREKWETGAASVLDIQNPLTMTLLALVLDAKGSEWRCLRYFPLGNEWNVSLDHRFGLLAAATRWAFDFLEGELEDLYLLRKVVNP